MNQVFLNGEELVTRELLHDRLIQELQLPEWYGRNLDALFDCLTAELTEKTDILLWNPEAFPAHLGGYGTVFLRMLREAAEENPLLSLSEGHPEEDPLSDYAGEEDL